MVVFGLSKNLLLNLFYDTVNVRLSTLLVFLPYLSPRKSEKKKYHIRGGGDFGIVHVDKR